MSGYFHEEVLTDILVKLPIKTLLQCTCVCKSWYSLISSPSFITTHCLAQNRNKDNGLLLLRRRCEYNSNSKELYSLHFDDEFFEEYLQLEFPFQSKYWFFKIVGSCNGLICLCDDIVGNEYEQIILWNPTIRRSLTLPRPSVNMTTHGPYNPVLGFGFDFKSNDYKVVRIVYMRRYGDDDYMEPKVEIYSLREGAWRGITAKAPSYNQISYRWSQAFISGAFHWIVYYFHDHSDCIPYISKNIISFDIGNEVFTELMLPESLDYGSQLNLSLAVFKESLSVFEYDSGYFLRNYTHCSIWVMKEYGVMNSWSKLLTISLEGVLKSILGLRKNGEILLARGIQGSSESGKLLAYDAELNDFEDLEISGIDSSFHLESYMESLILLNIRNDL